MLKKIQQLLSAYNSIPLDKRVPVPLEGSGHYYFFLFVALVKESLLLVISPASFLPRLVMV